MQASHGVPEPGYSGVLDRGLAVMELLSGHAHGLSLTAISETLRIPRSATHRVIMALVDHGYVRQESDRGVYALTTKLQVIAFQHLGSSGYSDAAQQVLDRLASQTGELIRLAIDDGGQLTWVAKAQGARFGLRYDPDMGMVARLSCSATGFAWLANFSDERALELVSKQGFGATSDYGPAAPQSPEELLRQVHQARIQGYAIASQTFSSWMAAIATTLVHPLSGKPLGVLSLAGPMSRLSEQRLQECAPLLMEAAREIGKLIPGSPMMVSTHAARLQP